ncbi:hypothetical protein AM493_19370 [Flavobacterium akiainvivens]|uniref:Lipoprotein n=1 Tax=Flavobacterium akiainvivens TaxID=1202724 RepID=A0A0M9VJP1_9FLAO|nr:hypothetical protein [Flavobacterium akiainvivens]KOS07969.1 hypothetical protein AM493_19370 [Flavobacterium akiainvivens]SFQ61381.1 hypothetical protein SAMN05444144_11019 [Flavobacterium akiainvivens]
MKNLILYAAIIAGITFAACSDDEDSVPVPVYVGCLTCEIPDTAPSEVEEQPYEVCIDTAGIAYVDNAYTGVEASYYFELNCANAYEEPTGPGAGPGTPTTDCVTCAAAEWMGEMLPEEVVCKGTNGNAYVDGEDMGVPFDQYIDLQEMFTTCQ